MNNALAISGLTKTYQDFTLDGVSFDVPAGSIVGLIGENGAALFAGGISLPCAYVFDPEKSQVVFMLSFMASTGIIDGLVLLTNLFLTVKDHMLSAFSVVLVISVIWFFFSYLIAAASYQKRDIVRECDHLYLSFSNYALNLYSSHIIISIKRSDRPQSG